MSNFSLPLTLAFALTGCQVDTGLVHKGGDAASTGETPDVVLAEEAPPADEDSVEAWFQDTFGLDRDHVYWGDAAVQTSVSNASCDGQEPLSPEEALAYASEWRLDWVGLTDVPELLVSSTETGTAWDDSLAAMAAANEDSVAGLDGFVVFPGFRWQDPANGAGDHGYGTYSVLFSSIEDVPAVPIGAVGPMPEGSVAQEVGDLWRRLGAWAPECEGCVATAMTIPVAPAMRGSAETGTPDLHADLSYVDSTFVRGTHLATAWGVEEGGFTSGMSCPDLAIDYRAGAVDDSATMRNWLYTHWNQRGDTKALLGFWGGSDSVNGMAGGPVGMCGQIYLAAVTGVAAESGSRTDLWAAMYDRAVVTSQANIRAAMLLGVETAGESLLMGQQGEHDGKVHVYAVADSRIETLELIVDGCVVSTVSGDGFIDEEIELAEGRHYIYLRGASDMASDWADWAWTSPIFLGSPEVASPPQ